jgi:hypothetical protein
VRHPWTIGFLGFLAAVTVWAAPLGALDVVNLNLLNGIACTRPGLGDGHQCRVHDRLTLLLQHLVAAGCPTLVTFQEAVTQAFVPQWTATGGFTLVGPLEDPWHSSKRASPPWPRRVGSPIPSSLTRRRAVGWPRSAAGSTRN